MAYTKYTFSNDDYKNLIGKSIADDYPTISEDQVIPFINKVVGQVYRLVNKFNGKRCYQEDAGLTEWELEQFKEAMVYQAYWILTNDVDLADTVGIDRATGQMLPLNELRNRYYSPTTIDILKNAGFLYSGV